MKKAVYTMKVVKQSLEASTSAVGFGSSHTAVKMTPQPRRSAKKTGPPSSSENLVPFPQVNIARLFVDCFSLQRKRKQKPDASEDRRFLEAVTQEHLRVAAGTLCCVCKLPITSPLELHSCALCEEPMHENDEHRDGRRCRAVHEEDCLSLDVSFAKKSSAVTKKSKSRRRL